MTVEKVAMDSYGRMSASIRWIYHQNTSNFCIVQVGWLIFCSMGNPVRKEESIGKLQFRHV